MEKLQIRLSQIRFTVTFLKKAKLPYHKESALRGGMGRFLLQQNCVQDGNCAGCSFRAECLVQKIMYARYQIVPDCVTRESMGFVLFCPDKRTEVNPGDKLTFTITLFGYTILYFSQIVNAFHGLGLWGLGEERAEFQISEIKNRRGEAILSGKNLYMKNYRTELLEDCVQERMGRISGENVRIRFLSPFSSKYNGMPVESLNKDTAPGVINAIARRIHMLMLYEGIPAEPFRFQEGDYVCLGGKSRKASVRRYSGTAESTVSLGGVIGYLDVAIRNPDLMKCVAAGELVQAGKNTRFGFGVYQVDNLEVDKDVE